MENISKYIKDESCCGCGLCAEICPKNAIEMRKGKEGFNVLKVAPLTH